MTLFHKLVWLARRISPKLDAICRREEDALREHEMLVAESRAIAKLRQITKQFRTFRQN